MVDRVYAISFFPQTTLYSIYRSIALVTPFRPDCHALFHAGVLTRIVIFLFFFLYLFHVHFSRTYRSQCILLSFYLPHDNLPESIVIGPDSRRPGLFIKSLIYSLHTSIEYLQIITKAIKKSFSFLTLRRHP